MEADTGSVSEMGRRESLRKRHAVSERARSGPARVLENQLLDPYINLMGEERASRSPAALHAFSSLSVSVFLPPPPLSLSLSLCLTLRASVPS